VVFVVAAVGGAPTVADFLRLPKRLAEHREGTRTALTSIRLEDGLSQEEAQIIANVYFHNHVGACGGAFHPRKAAGSWVFAILVGAAGAYSGDLRIQASTGRITMDGDVLFSSLEEFRTRSHDRLTERSTSACGAGSSVSLRAGPMPRDTRPIFSFHWPRAVPHANANPTASQSRNAGWKNETSAETPIALELPASVLIWSA
jgi:hypothetical protein